MAYDSNTHGYSGSMSTRMTKSNSSSSKPMKPKGRKAPQSPHETGHKTSKQRIATPAMKKYDGGMM